MTQKQYAEHRGCTQQCISSLIKKGKLTTGLNGDIDPVKADAELLESLDPGQLKKRGRPIHGHKQIPLIAEAAIKAQEDVPQISKSTSFAAARTANEVLKAKMAKLEYDKAINLLVSKSEMEASAFNAGRQVRDFLLAIPMRIAPLLGTENLHETIQLLQQEINKILENMNNFFQAEHPIGN